ncbi:uncharacterized protein LOC117107535 isoform X2 [Anneissia japonica]|uniref:uncharacterized protein LOC117107535 isoform X2 n=1 Tax=Anneissia japonica TaxID=1529436 RepID=UPI0014258942|nr:uncharacterized protein LOC117107535 isoform X2 [Anneissia japonica]
MKNTLQREAWGAPFGNISLDETERLILLILMFSSVFNVNGDLFVYDELRLDIRGRVEILVDGKWGSFCDYKWGPNESNAVCRKLSNTGGSENITGDAGDNIRQVNFNVNCSNEKDFDKCKFEKLEFKCPPDRYAAVRCQDRYADVTDDGGIDLTEIVGICVSFVILITIIIIGLLLLYRNHFVTQVREPSSPQNHHAVDYMPQWVVLYSTSVDMSFGSPRTDLPGPGFTNPSTVPAGVVEAMSPSIQPLPDVPPPPPPTSEERLPELHELENFGGYDEPPPPYTGRGTPAPPSTSDIESPPSYELSI